MKVFRIKQDCEHYRYLIWENDEACEALSRLDGSPKSGTWAPPPVRLREPKLKAGNFYNFGGGFLIADPTATEALRPFFEMAGELLPLPYKGVTYTVLNVTVCIDCLDHAKTTHRVSRDGRPRPQIERYEFNPDLLPKSPIFKLPRENNCAIFVTEGLMGSGQEFRDVVSREGLEGLLFHELWSSERGGTPWNDRTDLFRLPGGGRPLF